MGLIRRLAETAKSLLAGPEAWLQYCFHRASYLRELGRPSEPWLAGARNLHRGRRCFIIGNGPSLNKTDIRRLVSEITFGVNGIYLVEGFRPTYYATISSTYWKHHIEEIKHVDCERRFFASDTRELASEHPTSWIRFQRSRYHSRWGGDLPVPAYFSRRPDKIVQGGGTVLFVCLQLAFWMGFETAILLGVDHNYGVHSGQPNPRGKGFFVTSTGNTHFSDKYHEKKEQFHIDIKAMERGYRLAMQAYQRDGRRILNASPGSSLDVFPLVDFNTLFG